jgi:translation initiation factor IF-3
MYNNKKDKDNEPKYRVNGEIFISGSPMVRLIHEDGTNEICQISQARRKAEEADMDLIEINPNSEPPIVKIANYEKMLYELKKRAKKQNNTSKPLKEIQLSVSIAENDIAVKANNARRFIQNGSKVKVVLTMKGREKARREENKKSLYVFIDMLSDVAVPESLPKDEGDSKTIVILKKKK